MRENRQSGSEGGGTEPNRFSLPLLKANGDNGYQLVCSRLSSRAPNVRWGVPTWRDAEWRGSA